MKKLLYLLSCVILSICLQSNAPIWLAKKDSKQLKLYAELNKYSFSKGERAVLKLRGSILEGWHIYSIKKQQIIKPTQVKISHTDVLIKEELQESTPQKIFDEALHTSILAHKAQFIIQQPLIFSKNINIGEQDLHGSLSYQACNNKICAPIQFVHFKIPFRIINKMPNGTPTQ